MILSYSIKKTELEILHSVAPLSLTSVYGLGSPNKLIYGENLGSLKALLDTYHGKIDMVYIDPPYGTNEVFTVSDTRAASISKSGKTIAYDDTMTGEKYLEFIRERLIFLRELLSEVGSIYVHIDYKRGHYIKIIMDEIFGAKNFRNDISRVKCNPKNFNRSAYGNIKDLILYYSKSDRVIWNNPKIAHSPEDVKRLFKKTDSDGRRYTTTPLHAPGETSNGSTGSKWRDMSPPEGRHWRVPPGTLEEWDNNGLIEWSANGNPRKKIFLDESPGKKIQDIWEYKDPVKPLYPTEKNLDLLKMIVSASTRENSTVLDCFCGSGTTLAASAYLGREWIGIDESNVAIDVCKNRLVNYEFLQDSQMPSAEKEEQYSRAQYQSPLL